MESFFKLNLEPRTKTGNAAARSLRRNGKIPVNYYYGGEDNEIFWPKKPYASWVKNTTDARWQSPIGDAPACQRGLGFRV